MHKLFALIILTLCLGACLSRHNDYSDFSNLPNSKWKYNDTIIFTPVITDSVSEGHLSLAIRHDNQYIYSNIWVEVSYLSPDSVLQCDTMNIQLADIYGKWQGKGIGASFQIENTISDNHSLCNNRPIKIRHIMQADTLHGVSQVGILFHANKE